MASRFTVRVTIALAAVCAMTVAAGQTTGDGIFTAMQAERGQAVYETFCISCHEVEFYRTKLALWQQAPVVELFDAMSATMPSEFPGGLSTEQYLDVLAYIFAITGSPPGDAELTLDSIDSIEIAAASAPASP